MKKLSLKNKKSRIRTKLFAIVVCVLATLLVLISVFSKPMLFKVFAFQTYRDLSNVSESIDKLIPGTATYYFDLYSIAVRNNVDIAKTRKFKYFIIMRFIGSRRSGQGPPADIYRLEQVLIAELYLH